MGKYAAGIDGGGTGTTLECLDLEGQFLERKRFGAFNRNGMGTAHFDEVLTDIFSWMREKGECVSVCIGAAGTSNPDMRREILSKAEKYGIQNVTIAGDHEIALYGATAGCAGGIVIAGTGSIALAMDETGRQARAGGNGHLIDDEGSGYALGRDALRAVVRSLDQRADETMLTGMIFDFWEIKGREDLIRLVYGFPDKSGIAALAPLVEQAARNGDAAALAILTNGARELTELVRAVCRQLNVGEAVEESNSCGQRISAREKACVMNFSLMGGLLSGDTVLRQKFMEQLHEKMPEVKIVPPKTDAAHGAAMWALRTVIS